MRLKVTIAALSLTCLASILLWVILSEPAPYRDTIRHIASTKPIESAVDTTAHAAQPVRLANDLSHRPGMDWPGFLGPSGDGKSPEKGIKPWPTEGPRVVWTLALGEGYAAPSVCRGRLLIFDRVKADVRCRCLNSETGLELWKFTYRTDYSDRQGYDGGPRACPVTDGYRVYLHGPEGMLHCLRLEDGKLLWKVDTCSTFGVVQNLFGVASAPVLDGDRLLLQIGGSPAGSTDSNFLELESSGSCIVALDKRMGKVLFRCGHDLASYASPQVVAIEGKQTGLVFARSGLIGFDLERGEELFRYPFRSRSYNAVNASNAVVQGDRVFLTESYEIGCTLLSVKNNQIDAVWSALPRRRDAGLCCHWNTPILADGCLYGCASRHRGDAELRCIELATGAVKWICRPALNGEPAGRSSLTHVDGHFIYLAEEGWLFLVKANADRYEQVSAWDGTATSGRRSKDHSLSYPCWASPVLSHGLLYVRGKGRLICLEAIVQGND